MNRDKMLEAMMKCGRRRECGRNSGESVSSD